MTPDAPEVAARTCADFLLIHCCPLDSKLLEKLQQYVEEVNSYYGNVGDSDRPPGTSTTAYWLQHMPDNYELMQEIRRRGASVQGGAVATLS